MTLKLNFDADRNYVKTDWIEFFNDFVKPTDYDTNDWTITTTEAGSGDATEAIADANGGVLVVTNDNGASDADYLQLVKETITFAAGKKLYFGARWKVNDADGVSAIMGLHVRDTTPLDAADALYFIIDDDSDSDLDFKAISSGASNTVKTGIHVVADDTWMVTEFYYDGANAIELFVNGASVGSCPVTNAPTTELNVGFGVLGASDVISVDWIRVVRER
jgi:hypothetical protein